MREIIIDGAMMTSKDAMYTHFTRVFAFPKHFGNNLDALWDVLTEVKEPTTIYFENVEKAIKHLKDYSRKLIQLFQKLDKAKENYTVYFYPDGIIEEEF